MATLLTVLPVLALGAGAAVMYGAWRWSAATARVTHTGTVNVDEQSTYAAARPRTIGGVVVSAPWRGRGWDNDLRDGMRIPLEAEVAWIDPAGAYPYWRGRITHIDYEYAR